MAFYRESQPGAKNSWRGHVSDGMKKSARRRKCPKCERLGALKETEMLDIGKVHKQCRYCGYVNFN